MIKLVELRKDNVDDFIYFELFEEQTKFLPSYVDTLREAKKDGKIKVMLIKKDDLAIGFLAYALDEENDLNILRFMIDKNYQGRKYGQQSLSLLLEKLNNEFNNDEIWISLHPQNKNAINLYEKFKFEKTETGLESENEIFYCCKQGQ